jgi:hypothetical protein
MAGMAVLIIGMAFASSIAQDAADLDFKTRPVSKVIKLLKDMKVELEADAANDQAVFDKLTCWCETNEKDKTEATGTADKQIDGFLADIERLAAKGAQLKAEIAQTDKEVAKNKEALAQATAVREKEAGEFNEDEKDAMQSAQALKNAVFVLSKHHESFLQMPPNSFVEVRTAAARALRHATLLPSQKQALTALVQQPNANAGSYQPASGQIFGILKQMKEEFESNMSEQQRVERQAASDYMGLKSAKQKEIAAGTSQSKQKTQELADTENKLAQAKENLQGTRGALAADKKFLEELKLRCQQTDKDFDLRTRARAEEIAAVSEAISILSDDDAHDNFAKTLGFVQLDNRHTNRQRGAAVLEAAAKKTGSADLARLAASAKSAVNAKSRNVFDKIGDSIDDLIKGLHETQAEEVVVKDGCNDKIRENEKSYLIKQREVKELTAFIDEAVATVEKIKKEMVVHAAEIEENKKQMDVASEEREGQNKEFQTAVSEQRAAQAVLKKALARLQVFYKEKSLQPTLVQALVQGEPGAAAPPPPEGFKKLETNKGAKGVMQLIQNVIADAAEMEKDALTAETDAQKAYEEFILNANASIKKTKQLMAEQTEQKTQLIADEADAQADRAAALEEAENLHNTLNDLHSDCDFLLENFDLRQAARVQEMEALAESKNLFAEK